MIIESTKPKLFRINIELTLFLELIVYRSEIRESFIGSKGKIKNLLKFLLNSISIIDTIKY